MAKFCMSKGSKMQFSCLVISEMPKRCIWVLKMPCCCMVLSKSPKFCMRALENVILLYGVGGNSVLSGGYMYV